MKAIQPSLFDKADENPESLTETEQWAWMGMNKLGNRFKKIDPEKYCLSYSAGYDSELLRWYIENYIKGNRIKIVSVNTCREHIEIRQRMFRYADVILYPEMWMPEIKERFGMPCFTKRQDEIIGRYQRGSRSPHTMSWIYPKDPNTRYKFNQTAKYLLLNDLLPKISNECCWYTKELPLINYQEANGLKPIIGVRGSESISRDTFESCLNDKGEFRPIYDFPDEMMDALYEVYKIEIPKVYDVLDRTGCIGCPYGNHGDNTIKELKLVTPTQRKYAIDSFWESYKVLGLDKYIEALGWR